MPLDQSDLDRLSERNKLLYMELMEAHKEKEHIPLWKAVEKVNTRVIFWSGGLSVIGLLLGLLVAWLGK